MRATALISAALVTGAHAWTYPDCEQDNCYLNLIDKRYSGEAPGFCIGWIASTTTDAAAIPTHYRNCPDLKALSSACSCVAYTATHTSSITRQTLTSTLPLTSSRTSHPVISSSAKTTPTTPSTPATISSESHITSSSSTASDDATRTKTSTFPLVTSSSTKSQTSASPIPSSSSEVTTITTSISTITKTDTSASTVSSSSSASRIIDSTPITTERSTTRRTSATIFTTTANTIINCAATVTSCPRESTTVLTSIIPVSTAVYHTSSVEAPTPPLESSPKVSAGPLPLPPSTSSVCLAGQNPGNDGKCVAESVPFSQGTRSSTTTSQATTPTPAPTVPTSNVPSTVTAGAGRFGGKADVIALGFAAALF